MRNLLSITFTLLFGISLLWWGTDGFRAFTVDTATVLAIQQNPREIPNILLQDQDSQFFTLDDYKGKYVLTTFMYVSCHDLCPVLETNFREVYRLIPQEYLGEDVFFVSISFDMYTDTPKLLSYHSQNYGADGTSWRIARIAQPSLYDQFLDTFEVIVIPNEYGGFEHNAGIHLIDREGKLIDIFHYEDIETVAKSVVSLIENDQRIGGEE